MSVRASTNQIERPFILLSASDLSRVMKMDSRYPRIVAATAAASLLLQLTLTFASAPAELMGTTKATTTAASSMGFGCNQTCGGQTPNFGIQYPFGFSLGCPVQLNCNPDGTASIGKFPVQNITSDSITVTISVECDRPFKTISPLFGRNFVPTSNNEVLLRNCTRHSPCSLQSTIVTGQFQSPCNTSSGMMSCYYGKDNGSEFLSYSKLSEMECGILASSISESQSGTNQPVQFEFQTMQLEWWVNGDVCRCANHAKCTRVSSVPGGGKGYRCQCDNLFSGDGFLDGSGCTNYVSGLFKPGMLVLPIIVLIFAAVGILLFVCGFCCILCKCCLRWKNNRSQEDLEAIIRSQGSSLPRRYKYRDLKKLTRSFSEKLGEGGYGVVYKGKLRGSRRRVAVKILKNSKGDGEEFINEVASISRTAHVNIVELLGFCYEGKKRALLYDYMPNGSLDKFLPKSKDQGSPNCPLEWKVLHRIAVGIARGLEYLHQGCNTRILHFDIKPLNILLDHDFTPRISDFGLAKLCQGRESIVSMLGTRGTIGYIAPEVFSRNFGAVSQKSDVYSYGMLVFEVIGGKDRTGLEASRSSEMYFPDWVYKHLESGKALWMSEINAPEDEEIARKMMLVSLWCIQTNPSDRPLMSKVIEMMEGSIELLSVPPKPLLSSPPRPAGNGGTTTMSSVGTTSAMSIAKLEG